ncbi:class I SAM-dependent RNA methyltransferase [Pelistega sp. MC2]|uniref:THUMP domain-containing class I SAM-dependent RNA methyltransferase n=1 Tax=Pelistega sp. MC2 TaxID=1720297 RepID=UPI0008DA2363|nr:class I SAM-dependent RNA methyltransferase [Pelistega sp. MC2]
MTDQTPRKKLSLVTSTRSTANNDKARVRTGARAKNVAIKEIQKSVNANTNVALEKKDKPEKRSEKASFNARFDRYNEPSFQAKRTAGYAKNRPSIEERLANQNRPGNRFKPKSTFTQPAQYASYHDEVFNVFAPCPIGLEQALASELESLDFDAVRVGRSGCFFKTNWAGIMKANLYSRLATRILVQVAYAKVSTEDDIYELARQVSWERWFGAEQTLRVDTSAIRSPMQSLQFCNLRAKDGIVDHLRELEGERPSIDTVRPDAKVHLFLDADSATLYLDTSGESLFKRGWRYDKGQAPLRENLAAGILALAGWDPSKPLYDPFCGSGTILIEAAWIALGIPPGIHRPFAFERLRGMDRKTWSELKEFAFDNIDTSLETPLFGSDIDGQVIQAAQSNLSRAKLPSSSIQFRLKNALQATAPCAQAGFLITNPPYGERLGAEDEAFWREWSSVLKNNFSGWQVHVITNDMDFPKKLRLKPNRRTPIFNGDIECRLFGFEMVSDSYRQK